MSTCVSFPYKSVYMRDLDALMRTAKMPTVTALLIEALTYYEIYRECEDLKMHMVSSPLDNTDDLKVIDDIVTPEHMMAGNIDVTLETEGSSYIQGLSGTADLPDFLTRLLVMYEQVALARAQGHGIAMLDVSDPDHLRLSWTNVVHDIPDQPSDLHKSQPGPALH